MQIEIQVRINSRYGTYAAAIQVPDYMVETFAPMHTNDDAIFNLLDPCAITHDVAQKVIALRKNAADELSQVLTEQLLNAMKAADTHNGYKLYQEQDNTI